MGDKQPGTILLLDPAAFRRLECTGQDELNSFREQSNEFCCTYQTSLEQTEMLTVSMRMTLPEQELVVKNSSRLLIRDTTCSMSSSTLPFLLWSSLFRHCFFHWLNVFSIALLLRSLVLISQARFSKVAERLDFQPLTKYHRFSCTQGCCCL